MYPTLQKIFNPITYLVNKVIYPRYLIFRNFSYDAKELFKYSKIQSKEKLIYEIIIHYHIIEKGITMPERRFGFGKTKLLRLIELCIEYIDKYDKENEQILAAVSVIFEYKQIHDEENFKLDSHVLEMIGVVESKFGNINITPQMFMTREEYFSNSNNSFDIFSKSRHSLRNLSGPVELDKVFMAINLAQNSPSACNRQSVRVKIVINKDIIKYIFNIQQGNRGFGNLVDNLILVTYDQQAWNANSRNGGYIDSGIYIMNLLYSLQFYKIGACTLNCYFTPKEEKKLKEQLSINVTEKIAAIVIIGCVPDKIHLTNSHRNSIKNVISIIQ